MRNIIETSLNKKQTFSKERKSVMKFKSMKLSDDIEYASEVYGTPDSPNPEEAEMIGHGEIVSDNDVEWEIDSTEKRICYNK